MPNESNPNSQFEIRKLYRYTTLPVLIDMLETGKMVLLNPSSWEDRNDALIIEAYKKKANIPKLFAICFTHKPQTIHHWKSFANGSGGCCIVFDAQSLLQTFSSISGIRYGVIEYRKLNDSNISTYSIEDIPFIKRKPYEFEREYRIIWEGRSNDNYFSVNMDLGNIIEIVFNQQMPEPIFKSLKQFLTKHYRFTENQIIHSTILENKTWVNNFS
jgi:hypothetical protein